MAMHAHSKTYVRMGPVHQAMRSSAMTATLVPTMPAKMAHAHSIPIMPHVTTTTRVPITMVVRPVPAKVKALNATTAIYARPMDATLKPDA